MANGVFQYRKLDGGDFIRLLVLEPADEVQQELRGSLLHMSISECLANLLEPTYTALSYFWGSPERTCRICIDNCAVGITASLDRALRDMRHSRLRHRIWADALCIDQENDKEKSQQVGLMGTIYSAASHTIIHLPFSNPVISQVVRSAARIPADLRDEFLELSTEVLAAPWFTRAWVFQELVLSQDPWVQTSASSRVRWKDFCDLFGMDHVAHAMRLDKMPEVADDKRPKPFARISATRAQMFSAPMHALLVARRGIGATNPRDLVYANLGVINDRELCDKYIPTNYQITVKRVFVSTAKYFLRTMGFEALIRQALISKRLPSSNLDLPSWTPDWTCPALPEEAVPALLPLPLPSLPLPPAQFIHTIRNTTANEEMNMVPSHCGIRHPDTLSFIGLPFDYISAFLDEETLSVYLDPGHSFFNDGLETIKELLKYLPALASRPDNQQTRPNDDFEEINRYRALFTNDDHRSLDKRVVLDQERRAYANLVKLYRSQGKQLARGENRSLMIVPSEAREGDFVVGPSSMSERRLLVRRYEGHCPAQVDMAILKGFQARHGGNGIPKEYREQSEYAGQGFPGLRPYIHLPLNDPLPGYMSEVQYRFGQHGTLIGEAFCFFDGPVSRFDGRRAMDKAHRGMMQIVTLH